MSFHRRQAAASLLSLVLSFLASSHHWIHMGILILLGGSTSMMSSMAGIIWIRRVMLLMTLITVLYSVYRLFKHRCRNGWTISLTSLSVLLSAFFVYGTLTQFGW